MENKRIDSRGVISDYIFFSKYSRVLPDGKKETWGESVERVMQMHFDFLCNQIPEEKKSLFREYFDKAWSAYNDKLVLGSQRALQYGGPQMIKNNFRNFNCAGSYLNRIEFFQETMELLLSGCVPSETPILTKEGVRPFKDVKEGDLIWTRNIETGKKELKPVLMTHDVVVKSEDQIKISGLTGSYITSKKHPTLVLREGEWKYIPTGELKVGDILNKAILERDVVSKNEKAYFAGSYLGDGHSHKVAFDGLRLNMLGAEKEVVDEFARIVKTLSGEVIPVKDVTSKKHKTQVWMAEKVLNKNLEFVKDFECLVGKGMGGDKTARIRIPQWIRESNSYNLFVNFLAGLIDTDGHVDKTRNRPIVGISTISKQMVEDIQQMASIWGISLWVTYAPLEKQHFQKIRPKNDLYRITIPIKEVPELMELLICDHKRETLKKSFYTKRQNKKIIVPFDKIEEESSYLGLSKDAFWHFNDHIRNGKFIYSSWYTNRDRDFQHILQYDKVTSIETDLGLDENFKDISVAENNNYFVGEGSLYNLHNCGVGYSAQKVHTEQLPVMKGINNSGSVPYQIEDSIEGWALSTGFLIESYYKGGLMPRFDYSLIRPEGSHISGGFKAPGPEPLRECHNKIIAILDRIKGRKLRPFELHYLTCIIADAVISGGIRRSAMIAIFDVDDTEMLTCKSGDWFISHPELCRCNNSVAIYEDTPKEEYMKIFHQIREYGEPGILFLPDNEAVINPCAEALLYPVIENEDGTKEYGFGFCNLSEINGAQIRTANDFYRACEAASILGTFQAAYTKILPVLSSSTKRIMERDALIGVGITGMADHPEILFDKEVQRKGADIVKKTNEAVAGILGINFAARTTVIKPSGNASQLLGCASGVHAYHFRKYIRNIQASNNERALAEMIKDNPNIVSKSFWNPNGESVLSFPIELDENSMVRTDFSTLEFLQRIYDTEKNWIMEGTNAKHPSSIQKPKYHHNVSCTVSVKDDEWNQIAEWIWEHREGFCGLSFLPETGDLDYPQAPYTSYLDEEELVKTYGRGAILSSGLIVDGLKVFGDIWTATNAAMKKADTLLTYTDEYLLSYVQKHLKEGKLLVEIDGLYVSDINAIADHLKHKIGLRNDWVRRFKKFSKNNFNGDDQQCANCLKHVNIFHQWHRIKEIQQPDWNSVIWEQKDEDAGSQIGTACSGGACSI